MATQLNIKDPETIALARTMAKRSGRSVTATIRDALEQVDAANAEAAKVRGEQLLAELREIPVELPPDLVGKTSDQIIREFHEMEWQDRYGRDEWS